MQRVLLLCCCCSQQPENKRSVSFSQQNLEHFVKQNKNKKKTQTILIKMEKTAQWAFWGEVASVASVECYEVELDSHVIYMGKSMRIVVGATSSYKSRLV